ncbi:MAG: 4-(cytidine 5'-diphospho)-2-C-methyl-D-erythritol kinase [Actinomycetota bacterium]|nr:4-(cytidine 5'-diphospho)-2-C-methyl-D-erythritol kinase [Actinomycetota bacterium]
MLGAKAIARAKLNLFLDVGDLRQDGYHEIRSIMQTLELSDELYFRRTDGANGKIVTRCSNSCVPCGEENLVFKAIKAFAMKTKVLDEEGIEVFINKRIPVGAGLAGGSADAAAAIVAMNNIWELDLSTRELIDAASLVGSDVPFCILGGTALVTGRGEKVESLNPLSGLKVVLASSGQEMSTEQVYERFDSLRSNSDFPDSGEVEGKFRALIEGIEKRDVSGIAAGLHNSLEFATIRRDLVIEYKKKAESAGAVAALMTGSGPCVFALVSGLEEAAEVAWELEKLAPVTIVTSFSDIGAQVLR